MPATSKAQFRYIQATRSKYPNRKETPEDDKWVWDAEWTSDVDYGDLPEKSSALRSDAWERLCERRGQCPECGGDPNAEGRVCRCEKQAASTSPATPSHSIKKNMSPLHIAVAALHKIATDAAFEKTKAAMADPMKANLNLRQIPVAVPTEPPVAPRLEGMPETPPPAVEPSRALPPNPFSAPSSWEAPDPVVPQAPGSGPGSSWITGYDGPAPAAPAAESIPSQTPGAYQVPSANPVMSPVAPGPYDQLPETFSPQPAAAPPMSPAAPGPYDQLPASFAAQPASEPPMSPVEPGPYDQLPASPAGQAPALEQVPVAPAFWEQPIADATLNPDVTPNRYGLSADQLAEFRARTASDFNPDSWVDRNKMDGLLSGREDWSSNASARQLGAGRQYAWMNPQAPAAQPAPEMAQAAPPLPAPVQTMASPPPDVPASLPPTFDESAIPRAIPVADPVPQAPPAPVVPQETPVPIPAAAPALAPQPVVPPAPVAVPALPPSFQSTGVPRFDEMRAKGEANRRRMDEINQRRRKREVMEDYWSRGKPYVENGRVVQPSDEWRLRTGRMSQQEQFERNRDALGRAVAIEALRRAGTTGQRTYMRGARPGPWRGLIR